MAKAAWEGVVTTLVAERGDALTRYAWLLSGSAEDAADLVQDALVKTFGRLGNGFTPQGAEAYVRRTILNTFLDGGRRRMRWRRIAHLTAVPADVGPATGETELRLDLWEQLKKLTPRERACLVLRYYEDLKVDDIAVELDISAGAVKRYLSDGLQKMAISLNAESASELSDSPQRQSAQSQKNQPQKNQPEKNQPGGINANRS